MPTIKKDFIVCIGNVYVETNYLGLITRDSSSLRVGGEYRAPKWETRLGGPVVNFAVQAKRLGFETALIGKVGDDEAGKKLIRLLGYEGISTDLISTAKDPHIQTSIDSGLIFENGDNIQIVAGNTNQELSLNDIDLDNPVFKSVSAVYLGGFLKQTKLYTDYPYLLQKISQMGIRIFLDHGRIPVDVTENQLNILRESLKFTEGYLPNQEELIGMSSASDLTVALGIALGMGPRFIAVKLGKEGCRVKSKSEDIVVKGHGVRAVSTVGAGDVFNAGFITRYLSGKSPRESAEFANAAAALRVSLNKNPSFDEIRAFLKNL